MRFHSELDVACRLALAAGASARAYQTGSIEVGTKGAGEIVTPADLEADRIIIEGLREAFPEDALFTEESPDSPARLAASRVWIVDPIDSTSDFARGGDEYTVSIGLAVDGAATVGVVYNPGRDELFAGVVGQGVTLNGQPARVSNASELAASQVSVSRKEWSRGLTTLRAVALIPISSMAYKLARVAAGLDDGAVSVKARKEWGTCAGCALVVAGGGTARLLDGGAVHFNRSEAKQASGMVAAGPGLVDALRDAVASAGPERDTPRV